MFNLTKKSLYFFILIIFFPWNNAFSNDVNEDGVIHEIEVTGLKRTKEDYIQKLLNKYVNQPVSDINTNDVVTDLQATGIFSSISVVIDEKDINQFYLYIEVEEKLTLTPIPLFAYYDDSFMGGGVVIDSNAFGQNDNLIIGGLLTSESYIFLGSYSRRPVDSEHAGITVFSNVFSGTSYVEDEKGNTLREFDRLSLTSGLNISKKLTDIFSINPGLSYSYNDLNIDGYNSLHDIIFNLDTRFIDNKWNGWFLLNNILDINFCYSIASEGDPLLSAALKGRYDYSLYKGEMRFISNIAAYSAENSKLYQLKTSGEVGISIMPSNFKSEQMLGFSEEVEMGLFQRSFGTFSLYSNYQGIFSKNIVDDTFFQQGISLGGRLYLIKIALPALSAGSSFNITENKWYTTVSLGFSI